MRKSERCRSVMAVPPETKTLQVTGTICDVTRMAGARELAAVELSMRAPGGAEMSSPVAGSRCQVTSISSGLGLGSFFFCAADFCSVGCCAEETGIKNAGDATTAARSSHVRIRGRNIPTNRDRNRAAAFRRGRLWLSSSLRQISWRERLLWIFRLRRRRGISLRRLRSAGAGARRYRPDQRMTEAWAAERGRARLRVRDRE